MTMNTFKPLRLAAFALIAALATACAVADDAELDDAQIEASARAHIDLWQTSGQYYFHVVAGNGNIMLTSEGYTTRTGALNGILSVLDNGTLESRYQIFQGKDSQHYIRLRAANGRIIAMTEGYSTLSNARRAVKSMVVAVGNYVEKWALATGARFQVFEGADRQFYFNLYDEAGKVLLRSEGYRAEASGLNGAFATQQYGVEARYYQVLEASNGGFYLNLRAPNNEVVATSKVYATQADAEAARDAMMALLPKVSLL
jgi:uncharacterized protein